MQHGTQLEVTIDLENYTVNITNIPGMQMCHTVIRNSEGRLLLLGENIPAKEGDITWIKLFDLDPNPDNGFHQEDFQAFVFAINQDGAEIAEGISEPFHLNEGQVQFIKDTYTANHPPASPLSPRVEEVEDAAVEASDDTDEARNIQASPEIPPATTTDTDVEENLTEATPATEAPATDQPPTPSATVVPPMATPSPEEVAAYALEQMQKQLKEKDDAHVKELERVKAEKDAELERLQNARAAQTKQVAELQRVTSLAEQKLAAERATLQRAEREQRQRQEQEQAARAERQRLHEEEIANLRQLLAAVARVQQAQAANPAPAAAATPAPTPQPAQAANPTPTPPTAAAGATATETDDEPEEVHHARRFVWNGLHTTILVIILATVAALLILSSNNFAPSSEKLADMGDEAEIIRLQEESNRTKIKAVADSQKSAAALVPTPVVLDAEEKAFTGKGGDLSLAPSSIRDGARASVNMLNNSKFGDNARIEVNNKIDIHDNRQDNRQAIVHPNGWPLDWRPTLPVVVASDLPKGVSTFIIPLRGVQCIRVPVGWYIEPAMQDMAHIDVKYGNDTMCFDYGIGQPGNEISGNYTQIRIRPKGHEQTDVTVRVMVTPP